MDLLPLVEVPLFSSLRPADLRRLLSSLREIELAPGTIVFREGEPGDRFYLVLAGELEVVMALGTMDERVLHVDGPGESVGEMSLLNPDGRRSASVRTRTPVRVLEMTREELDDLLRRHPSVAYDLARSLSMRLQAADKAVIRDLHIKNEELLAAYQELKQARAALIEKEALERELQVAHHIQMSMVPRTMPRMQGFEFGARMMPARAVGGDFFDFIPLDEDRLGIVMGDVSGKGVPAALFMALACSLLRVEAGHTVSPRITLQRLNRYLLDRNDTGLFVTVLYGVLDRRSRIFDYTRAGHELPLVIADDGDVQIAPLGQGQPLGLLPDPDLDEQSIIVPPGSTLLLYTDGVTEAMDTERALFGMARLEETAAASGQYPPQQTCNRVWQAINAFRGVAPQADDITLVAVRAELLEEGPQP